MTNFIDEFINICEKVVDSPREFIEATAILLISITLGRFCIISGGREKQPNLFVVISCAPGIGRRSGLNRLFNNTLVAANSTYCKNAGFEDIKGAFEAENRATTIESGSPQGLVDVLEVLRSKGARGFLLNSPEFGIILDGIKSGGYIAGFNHLLCKLWSGEGGNEDFSRRSDKPNSRFLTPGTYFCLLGFMQKAEDYLDEKLSKVGLLRRLLLIDKKGKDMIRHIPAITDDYKLGVEKLEELGEEIGAVMIKYHKLCEKDKKTILESGGNSLENYPGFVYAVIDEDVRSEINRIEKEQHELARNNDSDPYYLYVQSRWEYVLKLAVCYALAEGKVMVKLVHFERAKRFVEACNKGIEPVIHSILVSKSRKERIRDKATILKYLRKKGECKTGNISKGLQWMGLPAEKRLELLEELCEEGRIIKRETLKRGNPTFCWRIKNE